MKKISTVAKTLQTCRPNTLFGAGTSAVSLWTGPWGRKLPELRVLWRLWEALLVFASGKLTYGERCGPIDRGCPNVSVISLISAHGQVMTST